MFNLNCRPTWFVTKEIKSKWFLLSDAMLARYMSSSCVCLSVCLSVTLRYTKTARNNNNWEGQGKMRINITTTAWQDSGHNNVANSHRPTPTQRNSTSRVVSGGVNWLSDCTGRRKGHLSGRWRWSSCPARRSTVVRCTRGTTSPRSRCTWPWPWFGPAGSTRCRRPSTADNPALKPQS